MSTKARFALILIDCQNGFVKNGSWARAFAPDQTAPILQSFERIAQFLRSIPEPSSVPVLISETSFVSSDREIFPSIADELSRRGFASITRTFKPHTNLSICPGVRQWLEEQLEKKLDVIIGGCTITSCVRDSSIQMKKLVPQLNFVVNRSLCSARAENYIERCSLCLDRYMSDGSPAGRHCQTCHQGLTSLSPVQLAFQQINEAGISIIDH